jgi:hypothetical protein
MPLVVYCSALEILFEVSILTSLCNGNIDSGRKLFIGNHTMLENIFNKMDKTNEGTFDLLLLHQ